MHTLTRAIALLLATAGAAAEAGSFTYRGQLTEDGVAADGRYDLQLTLYADPGGQRPLIAPIDLADVAVKDGQFAVAVELPDLLADTAWVEVSVRPEGEHAYWPLGAKEAVALKGLVCPDAWSLGGNPGIVEGSTFLGTTDNKVLELRSNNLTVARFAAEGSGASATARVTLGAASNVASSLATGTTIGGGSQNTVNGKGATIGGGLLNRIGNPGEADASQFSTIGGGGDNLVTGVFSAIGGGQGNRAPSGYTTVAGGFQNTAEGSIATIAGGSLNSAVGQGASILGGFTNVASGEASTVAGGVDNCAGANFSWASGRRGKVRPGSSVVASPCVTPANTPDGDQGTFVWADSQNLDFISSGEDQFLVRARGGVGINASPIADAVELSIVADADDSDTANLFLRQRSNSAGFLFSSTGATSTGANDAAFFIDHFNGAGGQARRLALNSDGSVSIRSNITGAGTGVSMAAGSGAWSALSDRHVKTAIVAVDPAAVLDRLLAMPISEWSYTAQGEGIRHLGPMAQDFAAAFGLGENATTISSIDADGVALAAIQGLNSKLERENAALRAELGDVAALRSQLAALQAELASLRRSLQQLQDTSAR